MSNETNFLQQDDLKALLRFAETSEDNEGYDVSKEKMRRLEEIGVIRHVVFSEYQITAFGDYVLAKHTGLENRLSMLLLKTIRDYTEEHRLRMEKLINGDNHD